MNVATGIDVAYLLRVTCLCDNRNLNNIERTANRVLYSASAAGEELTWGSIGCGRHRDGKEGDNVRE